MNNQKNNAKVSILPVDGLINAVVAKAIDSKVLSFPVRFDREGEEPVFVQTDSFVGCCEGCGSAVYASEDYRITVAQSRASYTCTECVAEEMTWRPAYEAQFSKKVA